LLSVVATATCRQCGTNHPDTAEYFYRARYGRGQCKEYKRQHRRANAEKERERNRIASAEWRAKNPERWRELRRRYYAQNRKKVMAATYQYTCARRKRDPNYDLAIVLRQRLCRAVRGGYKAGSAVADLGCSIDALKSYLESKFLPGMTWENRGRDGWHIDHVRPLASFDLSDPVQFRAAVHFTNLQPLWAIDNIRKADKLPESLVIP
jgi:hypothetical protein